MSDDVARDPRKRRRTPHSLRQLIALAAVGLAGLFGYDLFTRTGDRGPIWPLILAVAGFLYLWWLSILVFDLVFVWHRYIQADVAHDFLRDHVADVSVKTTEQPPDDTGPGSSADLPPPAPLGTPVFVPPKVTRDQPATMV